MQVMQALVLLEKCAVQSMIGSFVDGGNKINAAHKVRVGPHI